MQAPDLRKRSSRGVGRQLRFWGPESAARGLGYRVTRAARCDAGLFDLRRRKRSKVSLAAEMVVVGFESKIEGPHRGQGGADVRGTVGQVMAARESCAERPGGERALFHEISTESAPVPAPSRSSTAPAFVPRCSTPPPPTSPRPGAPPTSGSPSPAPLRHDGRAPPPRRGALGRGP
jgi:hypothetical protein